MTLEQLLASLGGTSGAAGTGGTNPVVNYMGSSTPDYLGLFNQMQTDYNNRPLRDKMLERGFTEGFDDSGNSSFSPGENFKYDTGNPAYDVMRQWGGDSRPVDWQSQVTQFNPRDFVNKYHVLPLDSKQFNGNNDYSDATAHAQGFNNLNDFLGALTGGAGGHIENVPGMGRVLIPNDPNTFDWTRDFTSAKSRGFINDFMDTGGMVKLIAAAITGGAASGAFGGAEAAGDAFMPGALGADGLGSVGAAGSGLAGDAFMPGALGAGGTGTIAGGAGVTSLAGGAGADALSSFNWQDPSTWGDLLSGGNQSGGLGGATGNPYAGLNYSQSDIDALLNGTYNGAQQTAAQSAGQLGSLNSLTQQGGLLQMLADAGVPTNVLQQLSLSPSNLSSLSKLFNSSGSGSGSNNSTLGALGTSLLGLLGADASRSANNSAADKMLALGEPARNAFNATLAPGWNPATMPGYQGAVDSATNSFLRAASAGKAPGVSGGNPMDNPGAWAETQKYVLNNTALPAINAYRSSLTGEGGIGVPNANTPNVNAANAINGAYNAAAGGLGNITGTNTDISGLLSSLGNLGGLSRLLTGNGLA